MRREIQNPELLPTQVRFSTEQSTSAIFFLLPSKLANITKKHFHLVSQIKSVNCPKQKLHHYNFNARTIYPKPSAPPSSYLSPSSVDPIPMMSHGQDFGVGSPYPHPDVMACGPPPPHIAYGAPILPPMMPGLITKTKEIPLPIPLIKLFVLRC
jgi:hypothetical protein